MEKNNKSDLEVQRMQYAFWLAVVGLGLSALLVIFLFLNGMTEPNEITAIVGIFTGVTGTLVGTFFGVQIGSAGRQQERDDRKQMEMMAMKAMGALDPSMADDIMKEMEG